MSDESPKPKDTPFLWFDQSTSSAETEHAAEKIERLESRINGLEDRLRENRFFSIFGYVFLFDIILFYIFLESSTAIVAFLVMEAVFLLMAAKRCGIEEISELFDRILSVWSKGN